MTVSRRNVSASVQARLANAGRTAGLAFDAVLTLYMMERLLYRLSRSAYNDRFVLKGGFLLFGLLADFQRTTSDLDLLSRHGAPELDQLTAILHDICGMSFDDGLAYDLPSLRAERIREGRRFEGVRVRVTCFLGPARKVLQLDIGFGDVVVPKPQQMVFPTILTSEESGPVIWAYTADSVVAEKFEAMVALATLNSRMKDFYDIFMLSDTADFDGRTLQEAVSQTLERRGTALPRNPAVFDLDFGRDASRVTQWTAFLRKLGRGEPALDIVLARLSVFLKPIYTAILTDEEFLLRWSARGAEWVGLQ